MQNVRIEEIESATMEVIQTYPTFQPRFGVTYIGNAIERILKSHIKGYDLQRKMPWTTEMKIHNDGRIEYFIKTNPFLGSRTTVAKVYFHSNFDMSTRKTILKEIEVVPARGFKNLDDILNKLTDKYTYMTNSSRSYLNYSHLWKK